ncbi:MAG TPA: ATPase [Patescibacteria group bacterium]|nr:ATPase [Patescibacteria group bacterium]
MMFEKLLDELENVLVDAARVPFTNKRVIEEDDLARFIDELRENLPREIVEAKRVASDRQRILDEAQKEAQSIVDQAKNYIVKLTDEHVITKHAQERAQEIVDQAHKTARNLEADAVNYADQVFGYLEGNVEKTLDAVRGGRRNLQQSQRSTGPGAPGESREE